MIEQERPRDLSGIDVPAEIAIGPAVEVWCDADLLARHARGELDCRDCLCELSANRRWSRARWRFAEEHGLSRADLARLLGPMPSWKWLATRS